MNNGDIGYCACKQSCTENEGYCDYILDYNYQCKDGHRCGSNNCPVSYGFDSNTDCCYVPIVGDEDFCTSEYLCGADEGDCDSNEECQSELFCGSNNCPNSLGVSSLVDCCEPQGKLLLIWNTVFEWICFKWQLIAYNVLFWH